MLNFFRSFTKSRWGLALVFAFLALIAIAFAASDITGVRGNSGPGGNVIATVGKTRITDLEVRDRVQRFLREAQRSGQNVTMEQFLAQGGYEMAVNQIIDNAVVGEFARESGMSVSKKLIDGDIASAPAFTGFDGKFDKTAFQRFLSEQRITMSQLYADATKERYQNWLVNRMTMAGDLPDGVLLPYASLQLERRTGVVGLIPTLAMDPGPKPDDKALAAWYATQRNRYLVPQRRVVRYAMVNPDAFKAAAAATDAEIADAYAKAGNRYAATEKRTLRQIVLLDQATANRVAGEVKGGKAIADVAKAAGLQPTNFDGVTQDALARQTSADIAKTAFGAAQGGVIGPVRSALGWAVLKVEKIEKVPAKTLDQVRGELADAIAKRKLAQKLADARQSIEDAIGDGKTFDEALRDAKLTAVKTPALTAAGINPDDPASKPDAALAPVLRSAFAFEQQGDEPQVVATGQDGSFAVVTVDQIVPAAPRPLAQIHDQVLRDYAIEKQLQKARAVASQVVAALQKGVPMQQALTQAGVTKAPPPKPFDFKRADIMGRQMARSIQLAFTMAPKKAKLVEGENREGYYVVFLDAIEQHSAQGDQATISRTRSMIGPQVGGEYARQFVASMRNVVKVKRNEKAIAALRTELSRTGAGN